MDEDNHRPPGLLSLVQRLAVTASGSLRNRGELLAVEWQEERARLTRVLLVTAGLGFLAMMGLLLLTATVIFLFPEERRVYVTAGFTVLYFLGALAAWFGLRGLLQRQPFAESLDQIHKDRVWLETLR